MPRSPRRNVPCFTYHLISRFVDRAWFISTDEERTRYLSLLGRAVERSDWRCIAFAVMSNHIHLGVVAGQQPLDSWMRRAHSPFAEWMNKQHDRIGTMFVRGPKEFIVAPHRVRDLIAYIHNNPVRAGIVAAPADSTWTSHQAYVGLASTPRWLDVEAGLARSGFDDREELGRWISGSTAGRLHGRRVEAELQFGSATSRHELVRHDGPTAHEIVDATANDLRLPLAQVCSPLRGPLERLAREVAVHSAARFGLTGGDIAAALEITQQAASKIRRRTSVSGDVEAAITRVVQQLAVRRSRQVV